MNHTATPWHLDYGGGCGKGHIYSDAFPGGKEHSLGAVHFPPLYEKGSFSKKAFAISEANATFIITACNAHEALLEAANQALEALDIHPAKTNGFAPRQSKIRAAAKRKLRDAIAQATSGEDGE